MEKNNYFDAENKLKQVKSTKESSPRRGPVSKRFVVPADSAWAVSVSGGYVIV